MAVGDRIKEIRNKLGMSQVDFADKISVSKQTLYKYENNIITNIPSDKIEAVSKIGNVSPAYLMGWDEPLEYKQISKQEQDHLNKYRLIDDKGKHTVDTVLEMEYNRCNTTSDSNITKLEPGKDKSHLTPVAAHERTDIEVTEEMKKYDDAFFDE